jgi:hypothetical protein
MLHVAFPAFSASLFSFLLVVAYVFAFISGLMFNAGY